MQLTPNNKIKFLPFLFIGLLCAISTYTCLGQSYGHNIQKVEDRFDQMGSIFTAKNAIVEDSLGVLWIGTSKGLCKYSGSTIKCHTHNSNDPSSIDGNDITFLMLDSDHLIWTAIYDQGINVFDISGKKVFDFKYQPNTKNALLHNRVWGMWEDEEGYVWISYFYGGLSRYDKMNNRFSHFSIDDKDFLEKHRPKTVVSIQKHDTESHTYWLATTRGLVKFNTKTFASKNFLFEKKISKKTSESQYNRNTVSPLWCRSICKDDNGDLWLGTFGALVKFDTRLESPEVIRDIDGEIFNSVPGVMNYDQDHIMLSYYEGLALFNIHTRKVTVLSKVDGTDPNHYLHGRMYKTSNNCVYILNRSGSKSGIYKFCPNSDIVKSYTTDRYITNLKVTDNYVHYHRMPGQVESRNLNTGERIAYPFEIKNGSTIRSMTPLTNDSILVSDFYHMYIYHPRSGLNKLEELSQDDVHRHESVMVDSEGDIWNGRQREGLFVMDHKTKEVSHFDHKSDPPIVYQDYIVDLLEDQEGDIWIATEQGWTVFDKKSMKTKNYLSKDIGVDQGINFRTINAFCQIEKGLFWIGTSTNGIFEWNKAEERITHHVNMDNGLRSDEIYDIAKDPDGNLWLATEMGLSWMDTKSKAVKNFGKEVGISGATYCIDFKEREIFAGHFTGYYTVHIDSLLTFQKSYPKPQIIGFELYDKNQDTLLYSSNGIHLPYDQNFFSFSFGSINYIDPQLEDYQYRLKGVNQDWIDDKGDRKSGYTNVAPGNYTFQVRIKTESDQWSAPASVKVHIHPAWYQTMWFKFLIAMALMGIIATIISSYVRRQRRELEIDKRFAQLETMILKSQMNPHFIFNSLNSIRYLFMKDEKEKGLKYITKFARLLRTTLHHGEHALVNLEDEIELTELFIQLEQLRFDDSFVFTSDYGNDPQWKEIKIPSFVIQPVVENAFWHGLLPSKKEEKTLHISIHKIKNGYDIVIEDNGVGFSSKSETSTNTTLNKTKSYGLSLIKERFELINKNEYQKYHLTIEDSDKNETGAKITIRILNPNS